MAESADNELRRSILMGSEVEYDFPCHPCSSGGRNKEAQGYCRDCGIYLCGQCIQYHKALPVTAHHQIPGKDKMPTSRAEDEVPTRSDANPVNVLCTDICRVHKDKTIEYYCPSHEFVGCTACVTLEHTGCKKEYLPHTVTDLENRSDYKRFKDKLADLMQKSKDVIEYGQERLKRATDSHNRILQDIDAFQQEVNSTLDKLKNAIRLQATEIKDNDTAVSNSIADEGMDVLTTLETLSKEIQEQLSKKQYSKIFIQMKGTGKKLKDLEDRLASINHMSLTDYGFMKNQDLQKTLTAGGLGTLFKTSDTRATHVTDINVQSNRDKNKCNIAGATLLSADHLVIVDRGNCKVKLFDVESETIISELKTDKTQVYPWDVTKVDDGRVAVTLPKARKILMLRYDRRKGLVIERYIKVTNWCWGIHFTRERLVVSFYSPGEVQILSLNGDILNTIATDDKGNPLFTHPSYVSASTRYPFIYVSDWDQHMLTLLDMNGAVKAVYKDDEPGQVTVDQKGLVYLCGENSQVVHLLTADCRKVKVILGVKDGLSYPTSICFCEATQRLYVGMSEKAVVRVYQMFFTP